MHENPDSPRKEGASWLFRVEGHLKVWEHHHGIWTPKKVGGSDHGASEVAKVKDHELEGKERRKRNEMREQVDIP